MPKTPALLALLALLLEVEMNNENSQVDSSGGTGRSLYAIGLETTQTTGLRPCAAYVPQLDRYDGQLEISNLCP